MNESDTNDDIVSEATAALISELALTCSRITEIKQLQKKASAAGEIRILAVPKIENVQDPYMLFGNPIAVDRLKEKLKLLQKLGAVTHLARDHYQFAFMGSDFLFRLFVSTEEAWFAQSVQQSSFKGLYITIATAAKNLGMKWCPSRGGFEDVVTGKLRLVKSEAEVFEVIKLPYVPAEKRNRGPVFSMVESGLSLSISKEEMREWVVSVPWTDTSCGGEFHQFTFRTSVDERRFVQMAEFIRSYGYDGFYLGKKWRYVDFEGLCYFTCGNGLEITYVLNRKKITHLDKPWVKNPEPWVPLISAIQSGREYETHAS